MLFGYNFSDNVLILIVSPKAQPFYFFIFLVDCRVIQISFLMIFLFWLSNKKNPGALSRTKEKK